MDRLRAAVGAVGDNCNGEFIINKRPSPNGLTYQLKKSEPDQEEVASTNSSPSENPTEPPTMPPPPNQSMSPPPPPPSSQFYF